MFEGGLVEEDRAQKAQQLIVRSMEWDNALAIDSDLQNPCRSNFIPTPHYNNCQIISN